MGIVFVLVVLAVIAWIVCMQAGARQQIDVSASLSEQEAAQLVNDYFGMMWTRVAGPGQINYRPKLRLHAPTLSVSFAPEGATDCDVSIWMSAFTTRYGLVGHAQLAWRKKLQLAARLRKATARSGNWTP